MECNFFKKFDQGSFQLVHKFDTIKTEYSDIIKKENSNETISAFNYQDKHEKLSKFSIITNPEMSISIHSSIEKLTNHLSNSNKHPTKKRKIELQKTEEILKSLQEIITLLNEQLAQDYKKKKNKPDFCENLPDPDIPWQELADEYINKPATPPACVNAMKLIKKIITELDALDFDDQTFEKLKENGCYKDKNSIFLNLIQVYKFELGKKRPKKLEKLRNWFIKLPNRMYITKLTKFESKPVKSDNTRIAFIKLFIKLISWVLKGKRKFKGVLSVISPELMNGVYEFFISKNIKIAFLKGDYLKKASVLRLPELDIQEVNKLENLWNEFVDSILDNEVDLLSEWLSLFCIRFCERHDERSSWKSSIKAFLKHSNCFDKLLGFKA